MRFKSIRTELLFWSTLIFVTGLFFLVGYSTFSIRKKIVESAKKQAISEAQAKAGLLKNEMEQALDVSRTLAQTLLAIPESNVKLSRSDCIKMMKCVLNDNPNLLGIYTAWEKDAFDGSDNLYRNSLAHDNSGRFVPYIFRSGSTIGLEPLVDYDTDGTGDYYQIPRKTGNESVINPYDYSIDGKDVLLTSLVVRLYQMADSEGLPVLI
jgi:methyl-accepting chemotaxis protein